MPQQYTFDAFRDAMSANGQLVQFKDPLNKKMSLSENIYRETVSSGSIKGDILYSRGSYRDTTLRTLYRMKCLRFLLHSEGSNSEKINTAK
jgi:hypothetical protein